MMLKGRPSCKEDRRTISGDAGCLYAGIAVLCRGSFVLDIIIGAGTTDQHELSSGLLGVG